MDGAAERAVGAIRDEKLPMMQKHELLHGRSVEEIAQHIRAAFSLEDALAGVSYIQENVPEKLDLKKAVFRQINDTLLKQGINASSTSPVIATSSSALPMSAISDGLELKHLCIVAHPVNPPQAIPLVELVPAPWTAKEVRIRARAIQEEIGQKPITLEKETPGFVLNRLQYALLAEAFRLVEDGVASAEDIDRAVKCGLGRRWTFMGPFQTIDLNAPKGVHDYCERYTDGISSIIKEQDNNRVWSKETVSTIHGAMRKLNGEEQEIPQASAWRDEQLFKLENHLSKQHDFK